MTLASERVAPAQRWSLTDRARSQMIECGITLSQLYRLVDNPLVSLPVPGEAERRRINGFGLTAVIAGADIISVSYDGADAGNWSDWAAEAAAYGDGDVTGADAMIADLLARTASSIGIQRRRISRISALEETCKALAGPVEVRYVEPAPVVQAPALEPEPEPVDPLAGIHPALHREIIRNVGDDFSRLIVHSPTKVTVLPAAP